MKPLIGITSGEIHNHAKPWAPLTHGQCYTYTEAVLAAGGVPIIIPIFESSEALKALYSRLDGILFAGGNDIDPARYKTAPRPETYDVSPARDNTEFQLMKWALADDLPIFAICRGLHLLNVASGGTLHQDIAAQLAGSTDHDLSYHDPMGTHIAHRLRIEPSSRLAAIVGTDTIRANSHHHQAANKLGGKLVATAWAEDDVIEAVELPDARFTIGVQCHPEEITHVETKWQLVFDAFIKAAQKNAS